MSDPITNRPIGPVTPPLPQAPGTAPADGSGQQFMDLMRDQLEQVSAVQKEADAKVGDLVSGKTEDMSEVFVAARKAQVAFSLLMEMRNKLVDAYEEVRNMRV